MSEEKKVKAPAKAKRPRLTAEQKIEQLKAQAQALEIKVKEKELASFSKDLESFTKLVNQLHTLYSKASELQEKLVATREEHNIDAWIPDPWVQDTEDNATVSLFDPSTVFHVALEPVDEAKVEVGE